MSFPISDSLRAVLDAVIAAGGQPYVVGGAVRDWILGLPPKDIDVECFAITAEAIELALSALKVDAVGKAFGVLKVSIGEDTFDISLPRRESKSGTGHRGFITTPDPNMTFEEACLRRDFTVNAIGWDVCAAAIADPHGGQQDIQAKTLRHCSAAFAEDPLRVLRGCQFAGRFGFKIAEPTLELCRTLTEELKTLPVERLWTEWVKLLTKSPAPSVGLAALIDTDAIKVFPEVLALLDVCQDPVWHPETGPHGSLWAHNCMVTDQAVRVLRDDEVTDEEIRLKVILGAFCHDFGKPATTEMLNGRWRSLAHEEAGEAPTRSFLTSIGAPPSIIEAVIPLVKNHLKPAHFSRDKASPSAIRRLSLKANITQLCQVARADYLGVGTAGRDCLDSREIPEINWLVEQASLLDVASGAPKQFLMGRHLIELGVRPGPTMGKILAQAFEAQLEGEIVDTDSALTWAKQNLSKQIP